MATITPLLRAGFCIKSPSVFHATWYKAAEKEGLDYYYLVDGGEIIGKGANVIWDFSKSKVGTYSITVGVGKDSVIKGRIITKSFVFEACGACDLGCACPNLSVSAPTAPAKRGENLIFSARILGGTQDRPAFSWSVSDGEIIKIIQKETESQILVKTSPTTKVKQVIATVEVGGLCMPECERTALAIAQIKK